MNTTGRAILQAVLTPDSPRSKPERDPVKGTIQGIFESVRSVATIDDRLGVTQEAGFGLPLHHPVNRFRDAMIRQLASEAQARESLRVPVRNSLQAAI